MRRIFLSASVRTAAAIGFQALHIRQALPGTTFGEFAVLFNKSGSPLCQRVKEAGTTGLSGICPACEPDFDDSRSLVTKSEEH
jgi:hypothetical protein